MMSGERRMEEKGRSLSSSHDWDELTVAPVPTLVEKTMFVQERIHPDVPSITASGKPQGVKQGSAVQRQSPQCLCWLVRVENEEGRTVRASYVTERAQKNRCQVLVSQG